MEKVIELRSKEGNWGSGRHGDHHWCDVYPRKPTGSGVDRVVWPPTAVCRQRRPSFAGGSRAI